MYRFFIEKTQIKEGTVTITGPDAHHIADVLRLKIGEKLSLSCQDGWEYDVSIANVLSAEVICQIDDIQKNSSELPVRITLYQCLPKSDKFELIIQKCVELGVSRLVPVRSSRTVVKIDDKKAAKKVERWNMIAKGAAEQSKRMVVPVVEAPVNFEDVQKMSHSDDLKLIAYENADDLSVSGELIKNAKNAKSISLLIGPEGGFSESEVEIAKNAGFKVISLGNRILRAETAPLALMAMLIYVLELDK